MPRFLHLADVHLGYDRYNSPERSRDFFYALQDSLERYAIAEQVDFVLIAGDLFEHKNVLPAVLNQAQACLGLLREAGIPALAIEGNHDHRPYGTKTSWLRYLADWDWLMLLEPTEDIETGENPYQPWNPDTKRGGYADLDCGVRVIGSRWYGSTAPQAIPLLANHIQQLPPGPDHTLMMFHHGLQGQIARYQGALDPKLLYPLQEAGVDYLALGHIHKNYVVDEWIFNPGSVEANSIAEGQEQNPRGVYLVEINAQGIQAELKRDYQQRPILRLNLEVEKSWSQTEVETRAVSHIQIYQTKTQGAIVELRLQGQVGFNRLDVNVRELRDRLHELSGALIFILRYDVIGTEYGSETTWDQEEPPPRLTIEKTVFADLLAANVAYEDRVENLAQGLINLKESVLSGRSDDELYQLVETLLQVEKGT